MDKPLNPRQAAFVAEEPAERVAADVIEQLAASPDLPEVFSKIKHPKKRAFLLALTTTPNLGAACKAAGISRPTYWNWNQEGDADYDAAFVAARDLSIKAAEAEAWKRATDGTLEDVYGSLGNQQGTGVVGQKRVKSDTMLIFMLKGAAPQKYRENFSHEVSGKDGEPITFSLNLTRPHDDT